MSEHDRSYYFKIATDGISLLWLFHQERVDAGGIPFVVNWWDPNCTALLMEGTSDIYDPLSTFSRGVFYSIRDSLLRLEDHFGVSQFGFTPRFTPVPISPIFNEKNIAQIFWDIRGLSRKHALTPIEEERPGGVLEETLEFGIDVITQMRAICGTDFKPHDASLLSKISTHNTLEASRHLGLRSPLMSGEVDYDLFVPGRNKNTHLNLELLQKWGLGSALGCPAAQPISPELRSFLRDHGVVVDGVESVVKGTMLTEFAKKIGTSFSMVDQWFLNLSETEKESLDSRMLKVLDGTIWKERKKATTPLLVPKDQNLANTDLRQSQS